MTTTKHPLVRMEGIKKQFPGVQALSEGRFELMPGEVHALVGENGAGKSTLMKILAGIYQQDAGKIWLSGRETEISGTRAAQQLGISIIHQELNLIPDLTLAQNLYIGRESRKYFGLALDEKTINERTSEWLGQLGLALDPRLKASELSVAKQQMVEIAKALSYNAKVLIMDEPTAALTDTEIKELFRMVRKLRAEGVGIVYISHRMEELKQISDRITVMRDGQYIATVPTAETSIDRIIAMMVGRELQASARAQGALALAEPYLEVRNLSRQGAFENVSFSVRPGEIVGLAGLMGSGRTEVARAVFGADRPDHGEIYIQGQKVRIKGTHHAVAHGIGYLSEDRKRYGVVVDLDVKSNIALPSLRKLRGGSGWMKDSTIHAIADHYVGTLKIKTPSVHQKVRFLSGGNQQKVVIGKWLHRDCRLLIFDEPTRGIDVGAKSEIYTLLEQLAAEGKAVLMISSELPEVLRLSHRILVMHEGKVTGELDGSTATQEQIMRLATGN
ncbi:sugar ABC transporter ATP-binding protein [Paenibacillus albus]|uniref:Sugar ABC transporter ATP-binding protein n=1 Tax=Paenibacillus albus TaxID=2495582 RepID=A0A3Q8X8N4_9BACL|nr:sugar ABC transporter ATP-binding protein [Paenibacillus albus]AZN42883.1 sugar ABC transporter ATP-binding protein [Paenibacillus albus]